jgi:hypothetical protein
VRAFTGFETAMKENRAFRENAGENDVTILDEERRR